ncbi:MAG: hypothetical protein ACXQTI_09945 [Candidatus Nezhaarchaeales archaeon]
MSIPPEIAWIVPIVVPFIIGLLIGIIIKKALKLALAVLALIIVLAVFGYIAIPSVQDVIETAMTVLPQIQAQLGPLINILPYSSFTFIIGLILGLWKG